MKKPTLALVSLLLHLAKAYTGDMTYYETGTSLPTNTIHHPTPRAPPLPTLTHPGLGSCGYTNSDSDAIVALSTEIMANGPNPNTNPKCGTSINIYNPATGKTHSATIVDTCEGCSTYDIDVSPSVFKAVDPNGLGDGRIVVDVRHFSGIVPFSSFLLPFPLQTLSITHLVVYNEKC